MPEESQLSVLEEFHDVPNGWHICQKFLKLSELPDLMQDNAPNL